MRALLVLIVALVVTCAACNAGPSSPPVPDITAKTIDPSSSSTAWQTSTPASTMQSTPIPTTSVTRPKNLSELEPCGLLSDEQAAVYGYTSSQSFELEGPRTCSYTGTDERQLVITFAASGTGDITTEPGETVASGQINDRATVRKTSARPGMCTIYLSVSANTMATVQVLGRPSTDAACAHASEVAYLIEPSLP